MKYSLIELLALWGFLNFKLVRIIKDHCMSQILYHSFSYKLFFLTEILRLHGLFNYSSIWTIINHSILQISYHSFSHEILSHWNTGIVRLFELQISWNWKRPLYFTDFASQLQKTFSSLIYWGCKTIWSTNQFELSKP